MQDIVPQEAGRHQVNLAWECLPCTRSEGLRRRASNRTMSGPLGLLARWLILAYNGHILPSSEEPVARVAALFDMDRTLLDATSGALFARYLYRNGQIRRWDLARVAWWTLLGRLGLLTFRHWCPACLPT
jgi:hypothetical protein